MQLYTENCSKLLVQYKQAFKQVQGEEFPTVEAFMAKYRSVYIIFNLNLNMDFDPIKSLDNIQSSSSSIFLCLSPHIIFICADWTPRQRWSV